MELLKSFYEWHKRNPGGTLDQFIAERKRHDLLDMYEKLTTFINSDEDSMTFTVVEDKFTIFKGVVKLIDTIEDEEFEDEM